MVLRAEQIRIGRKKETTFAETPTAGAQTGWADEILSGFDTLEDIDWKTLWVKGGDREAYQMVELKHTVEDSFDFAIQTGLWFAYALGKDIVSGAVNPFTHTITPLMTMPFPSQVMEVDYLDASNFSLYLKGLVVDSLHVTGGEADILSGTVNFKAHSAVKNAGALSTVATDTTQPYKFSQATLTYFGSALARPVEWSFGVDNKGTMLNVHDAAIGLFPKEYIPHRVPYELETTVVPVDSTYFDQLKVGATNLAATLKYVRVAAPEDSLSVQFTNCVLKSAPYPVPEEGESRVKMTLVPRNLTVVVLNPQSTAYV